MKSKTPLTDSALNAWEPSRDIATDLRQLVAEPVAGKQKIPVFKGFGGLVAGVNPISNKAMLDVAGDNA